MFYDVPNGKYNSFASIYEFSHKLHAYYDIGLFTYKKDAFYVVTRIGKAYFQAC